VAAQSLGLELGRRKPVAPSLPVAPLDAAVLQRDSRLERDDHAVSHLLRAVLLVALRCLWERCPGKALSRTASRSSRPVPAMDIMPKTLPHSEPSKSFPIPRLHELEHLSIGVELDLRTAVERASSVSQPIFTELFQH